MTIPDFNTEFIKEVAGKEAELLRLIQVKAEKLTNIHLEKDKHTQLSYLPKEQQEFEVAIAKEAILNHFIAEGKRL